jgi:translation initiation factor 1A
MGKQQDNGMTREQMDIARIRVPRRGEILGIVEQMLGNDRMRAHCSDGNVRICRIPGRLRKRAWAHMGDMLLLKPWVVQSNERADIAYVYKPTQANWLRRKGYVPENFV